MRILIATLCFCLGLYFTAATGSGIILRTAGHTPLFTLLEALTGYLPYVSVAILIIVGIVAVLRNVVGQPRALVVKLPLTLIIALIPLAVHMATYSLTYSTGPAPQRTLWGSLSKSEWAVFLVGCLLIGIGIFLQRG